MNGNNEEEKTDRKCCCSWLFMCPTDDWAYLHLNEFENENVTLNIARYRLIRETARGEHFLVLNHRTESVGRKQRKENLEKALMTTETFPFLSLFADKDLEKKQKSFCLRKILTPCRQTKGNRNALITVWVALMLITNRCVFFDVYARIGMFMSFYLFSVSTEMFAG